MPHRYAPNQLGVRDHAAMATPPLGFRAHDGGSFCPGQTIELSQARIKFRRLHIVGIAAKTRVSPAGIDGLFSGMTQTTEEG